MDNITLNLTLPLWGVLTVGGTFLIFVAGIYATQKVHAEKLKQMEDKLELILTKFIDK